LAGSFPDWPIWLRSLLLWRQLLLRRQLLLIRLLTERCRSNKRNNADKYGNTLHAGNFQDEKKWSKSNRSNSSALKEQVQNRFRLKNFPRNPSGCA